MSVKIFCGAGHDGAAAFPASHRGTEPPNSVGLLTGYAAVFFDASDPGTEYHLGDDLVEHVMPRCFDRALAEGDDCRCLVNHQADLLLGRTVSGTLRLSSDRKGLRYECDLANNSAGRDAVVSLGRRDMSGSSFCFAATEVTWVLQKDGPCVREINSVALFDVSPVTYPAYPSTSAGVDRYADPEFITNSRNPNRAAAAASGSMVRRRLAAIDRSARGIAEDWPDALRRNADRTERAVRIPISEVRARRAIQHDLVLLQAQIAQCDADLRALGRVTNPIDRRAKQVELEQRIDRLKSTAGVIDRYVVAKYNRRVSPSMRVT